MSGNTYGVVYINTMLKFARYVLVRDCGEFTDTTMVFLFVFAVCLLGTSFGDNSFKVCDDAQIAFDGFDLTTNDNIAWKEKRAFFESADCNGDDVVSEDEFSCKWQNSGVDMEPFFQFIAGSNEAVTFTYPNYLDFLNEFDTGNNGRVSADEFVKHWVSMIVDHEILLQETSTEPDIETLQQSTINPLTE